MAIKAQRSSDAAAPRPYWADREARNSRDDRRRAPPINVDDPRRRYHVDAEARLRLLVPHALRRERSSAPGEVRARQGLQGQESFIRSARVHQIPPGHGAADLAAAAPVEARPVPEQRRAVTVPCSVTSRARPEARLQLASVAAMACGRTPSTGTTSILIDITSKELSARLRRVLHLDEDLAHARRVPRRGDRVRL